MKARILHEIDGTTTETVFEGHRVTGQIMVDGRGMCQAFDEGNTLIRRAIFLKAYLIDISNDK